LIADRGRHAAEQRRDLRARLNETEDVVDEQQHVLVIDVAEVLRDREGRERHAEPHAGRLVHLPVDQGGLVENPRLLHLEPEVVALSGSLADAGEHRHATVLFGDAIDHLLDHRGLADAGATEHADLSTLDVGLQEVDDLDPRLEHLDLGLEVLELRWAAVDRPALHALRHLRAVNRLAQHVVDVPEHVLAYRDRDRGPRIHDRRPPHDPVDRLQADGFDRGVTDVLGDLGRDDIGLASERSLDLQGVTDLGERVGRKLRLDHRAGDTQDAAIAPAVSPGSFLRMFFG
jgi:hypothetical protein